MSVYNVQPDGSVVKIETPTTIEQYLPSLDSTKLIDSRSVVVMCTVSALIAHLVFCK